MAGAGLSFVDHLTIEQEGKADAYVLQDQVSSTGPQTVRYVSCQIDFIREQGAISANEIYVVSLEKHPDRPSLCVSIYDARHLAIRQVEVSFFCCPYAAVVFLSRPSRGAGSGDGRPSIPFAFAQVHSGLGVADLSRHTNPYATLFRRVSRSLKL